MLAGVPLLLEATVIKTGRSRRNPWNRQVWVWNQRFAICYYDFSDERNKPKDVSLNFCTIHSSYQHENATRSEFGVFTHRHCEALLLLFLTEGLWDSMWLCPRGNPQKPYCLSYESLRLPLALRKAQQCWWYHDSFPSRWDQSFTLMNSGKNEMQFH